MRGLQCRIQVNVEKVYVGSSDVGGIRFMPAANFCLAGSLSRSGAGEYRTPGAVGEWMVLDFVWRDCYGLTIHDVENTWQLTTHHLGRCGGADCGDSAGGSNGGESEKAEGRAGAKGKRNRKSGKPRSRQVWDEMKYETFWKRNCAVGF